MDAFLVTHKREQTTLMGIPVCEPNEIPEIENADAGIIVGLGARYRNEVEEILKKYKVQHYFLFDEELFKEVEANTQYSINFQSNKNICVLLYHRVCKLSLDIWQLAITPEVFEAHIRFFKENYNILRFEDDWDNTETPSLVITFDDGYADNYLYALPILEKYQVPATIFVSTGNLGTDREFWWDELERIICLNQHEQFVIFNDVKYSLSSFDDQINTCRQIRLQLKQMLPEVRNQCLLELRNSLGISSMPRPENRSLTIEELRHLAQSPYITIGGHTMTHNMLSAEPEDMQKHEICGSKSRLEELLQKPVTTFSYPFGTESDFTDTTANIVKAAGYQKAATTSCGLVDINGNAMYIPRNGVPFYPDAGAVGRHLRKLFYM